MFYPLFATLHHKQPLIFTIPFLMKENLIICDCQPQLCSCFFHAGVFVRFFPAASHICSALCQRLAPPSFSVSLCLRLNRRHSSPGGGDKGLVFTKGQRDKPERCSSFAPAAGRQPESRWNEFSSSTEDPSSPQHQQPEQTIWVMTTFNFPSGYLFLIKLISAWR